MNKDTINRTIAEACGFTDISGNYGFHQKMSDEKAKECSGKWRFKIPDYTDCLNAIHDAKRVFNEEQNGEFIDALCRVCHPVKGEPSTAIERAFYATAGQQAEAFLRTLNLWTPTGEENE